MQVQHRKRKAPGSSTVKFDPNASRFVSCPVCTATVPAFKINEHLDDACIGATNIAADDAAQRDECGDRHPRQQPTAEQKSAHDGRGRSTAAAPPNLPVPATPQQPVQPSRSPQRSLTSVLSASASLVYLRRHDERKVALSDEQLKDEAPCELVRNALPPALATELLKVWSRLCCVGYYPMPLLSVQTGDVPACSGSVLCQRLKWRGNSRHC